MERNQIPRKLSSFEPWSEWIEALLKRWCVYREAEEEYAAHAKPPPMPKRKQAVAAPAPAATQKAAKKTSPAPAPAKKEAPQLVAAMTKPVKKGKA